MCGIIGVFSYENSESAQKLNSTITKMLLLGNQSRGPHSTGVASYTPSEGRTHVFKRAITAQQFVHRWNGRTGQFVLGHTRWATLGAITDRNAHPFTYKGVTVVHNGVISNHAAIAREYGIKYNVDSEVLAPIIYHEDWSTLERLDGSFNFLAIDQNKNRIYINRHDNPLYMLDLGYMICFSSEEEPLFIAGNMLQPVEVKTYKDDCLQYLDLSDNSWHDIDIDYYKWEKQFNLPKDNNWNKSGRNWDDYTKDNDKLFTPTGRVWNPDTGEFVDPKYGSDSDLLDDNKTDILYPNGEDEDPLASTALVKDVFCDNCGGGVTESEFNTCRESAMEYNFCDDCLDMWVENKLDSKFDIEVDLTTKADLPMVEQVGEKKQTKRKTITIPTKLLI